MQMTRLAQPAMADTSVGATRRLCLALGLALPGLGLAQVQPAPTNAEQAVAEPVQVQVQVPVTEMMRSVLAQVPVPEKVMTRTKKVTELHRRCSVVSSLKVMSIFP